MGFDTRLTRQQFLTTSVLGAVGAALPFRALAQDAAAGKEITLEDLRAAERMAGLEFTDKQREAALAGVKEQASSLKGLREGKIGNDVGPATVFVPQGRQPKPGRATDVRPARPEINRRPASDEDLAFLTVAELGHLLRTRQVTSRELTELSLARLRRYGPKLRCLVTLMEADALRQADRMDQEAAEGRWRGPLHGVPCGIKDLFATKGHRTTWGAEPYREQVIDTDAAVVERLREAGAVLCAKLSLGALAMADHWFEGLTLNPWDPKQGSSGSSAGSASAMAAGLVPFTVGTETLGSIMSPSQRCRVTGLRPTFGRISRHGAMALSWTMDKVGPICRTAEDCALVLGALHGHDPRDPASVDRPFRYRPPGDLSKLKIGFLSTERLDEDDVSEDVSKALEVLRSKGANDDDAARTGDAQSGQAQGNQEQPSQDQGGQDQGGQDQGGQAQGGQAQGGQDEKKDEPRRKVKERQFQLDDLTQVTISVREHKFKVWVMDDHLKRQEGMMFLQDGDVKPDEGMIFVFPDIQGRRFWMKNTLIPLDIAYLNLDGKILNTYTMRALDTTTDYSSHGGAIYVVELKAGTFAKKGIRAGDKFMIPQEVVARD
jgi:uncharacterized membrane protein (UPF0127 family)